MSEIKDEDIVLDDEDIVRDVDWSASEVARNITVGMVQPLGLQRIANTAGIAMPKPGDENPSPGQAGLRFVGNAVGLTAAVIAPELRAMGVADAATAIQAANVARQGVQGGVKASLSQFAKSTAETAIRRPKSFVSMEAASAAAAGATGALIYNETDSPTAKLAGELIGGTAVPAAVTSAMLLSKVSMIGAAVRAIPRMMGRRGVSAANTQRAATRLDRAVPGDAGAAIATAEQADVLPGLTFAERSGEPGLLSLEASVIESSDELSQAAQRRFAEINGVIRSNIVSAEAPTASPAEMRGYLDNLLEERLRIAAVNADEKIGRLGPKVSREQANHLARVEIDKAYDAALTQERELWDTVPEEAPALANRTIERYQELLTELRANRVTKERRDMPEQLKKFLGGFETQNKDLADTLGVSPSDVFKPGILSENATIGELKELRSTMLGIARLERSKAVPNRRKIGLINQLDEQLLADMQAADPTNEALNRARGYSADLNTRFRQGEVGDILGFAPEGGADIRPGLTLERTLGLSKMKGAVATDALTAAVERSGNLPAMRQHMEDFLSDEFLRVAKRSGDFSVPAAERYLADRQDVLARFPELKRRFSEAIAAGNDSIVTSKLVDPKQSPAAVVLNAPPGEEIARLVRAKDPAASAAEVAKLLATDETGKALPGMRRAFFDWILDRSKSERLDANDTPYVSGTKLQEVLEHPGTKSVARALLTPEQVKRLVTIKNTALAIDKGRNAKPSIEGIIGDREGILVETGRRIVAAATFRHLGRAIGSGGTVQIPGIGVKLSEHLQKLGIDPARKLIVDAITSPDDKLLKALMTTPMSLKAEKAAQRQVNAWVMTTAADYGITEEEAN